MKSWDQVTSGLQKTHRMTRKQRQARLGNQEHFVLTTAARSNTIPTRQHLEFGEGHHSHAFLFDATGDPSHAGHVQDPELGQAHNTRMDFDPTQRVTASRATSSRSQP